jgi:hypothetical protein
MGNWRGLAVEALIVAVGAIGLLSLSVLWLLESAL